MSANDITSGPHSTSSHYVSNTMQAPYPGQNFNTAARSARRLFFRVINNTQFQPLQILASYQHENLHPKFHQTGYVVSNDPAIVTLSNYVAQGLYGMHRQQFHVHCKQTSAHHEYACKPSMMIVAMKLATEDVS